MSSCCGNPGVGIKAPKEVDPYYDTFNPSEVRLYGRPALATEDALLPDDELLPMITKELEVASIKDIDKGVETIKKILGNYHAFTKKKRFITLPVPDGTYELHVSVNGPSVKSIGVIYGYAYEGHCYKMPKPQIMYLPVLPKNILGNDCGCDCGYSQDLGYTVWQIDKKITITAIDIRSDDIKTIVLDENLPGNRSPQAYGQSMSLAPMRARG